MPQLRARSLNNFIRLGLGAVLCASVRRPEVAEAQARYYGRIFRVVLKHPGVVTRVTFWGTHDGTSWLNFWPVAGRTNHPLLWGRDLKPKPALGGVLDALATP
jgi:endo-1,4-beta-xylanase